MSISRLTPDRVSIASIEINDQLKLPPINSQTSQAKNALRFEFTTSPKYLYKCTSTEAIKPITTLSISDSTLPSSVKPITIKRPNNTKTIFQSLELHNLTTAPKPDDDS